MDKKTTQTTSIRFVYLLNMLPIIGLMMFYYTRYIEGTYSIIIPLGLLMLWIAMSILAGKNKGIFLNKIGIWWLFYLFLYVFMVLIGFSSTNLNFVISRLPIYIIPIIGFFVVKHYNTKEKAILLIAFFTVYLINLLYNSYLGYQFPDIFEEQASTEDSVDFCVMMNIASTSFVGLCPWMIGVLLMSMLAVKKKGWVLLCSLLIIPVAYYMLFQNTRGIAVLLLLTELLGFVLASFEPVQKNNRTTYYIFMSVLIIVVLLIVFIPAMNWVLEHIQSERLAERFNDLLDLKKSGGDSSQISEGSLSGRIMLIETSFNTFLSSPISVLIGIGDHTQSFGGDLVKSGIGNHSEFVDVLARFGLVGAIIVWNIMKYCYRMLNNLSTKRVILRYVNIIFVIIVLYGFLNLMFLPDLLLFLYIAFPILIELTDKKLDSISQ